MYEASTEFDLENVKPFLQRISRLFTAGFDQSVVEELYEFTAKTAHNEEHEINLPGVVFDREEVELRYRVFMDDIDCPGVYFFTDYEPLAQDIMQEIIAFGDELGI